VRDLPAFPAAFAHWLDARRERDVYALGGALGAPDHAADARALLPPLPEGWTASPERSFRWRLQGLERTTDRRPRELVESEASITLFRLHPPPR
jgi:hypothetical protein